MATTKSAIIVNAFDTTEEYTLYRVVFAIKSSFGGYSGGSGVKIETYDSGLSSVGVVKAEAEVGIDIVWYGVNLTFPIYKTDYRSMQLTHYGDGTFPPGQAAAFRIKNFRIYKIEKAQLQDSDLFTAGRRTSYYEGCKMSSPDYNINSLDTADGGPVIVVNTVAANTPSSSPIGSSIGPPRGPAVEVTRRDITPPQD